MNLIVANWKENLTIRESLGWLEKFSREVSNVNSKDIEVVICPQYPAIPILKEKFSVFSTSRRIPFSISLGAQDVSKFEEGAYTGEVSIKTLSLLVNYVIVGHSERRENFNESSKDVVKKAELCVKYNIVPIVCVSNLEQLDALKKKDFLQKIIFTWETSEHISGGGKYKPDSPAHASIMCGKVKEELGGKASVLYGGSINSTNAKSFLEKDNIDGALVGQASLNPLEFAKICAI